MIIIQYDDQTALVREPGVNYEIAIYDLNEFIKNHLKSGYQIKNVVMIQRGVTSVYLDKPKKQVKKSYPYWLRKKWGRKKSTGW